MLCVNQPLWSDIAISFAQLGASSMMACKPCTSSLMVLVMACSGHTHTQTHTASHATTVPFADQEAQRSGLHSCALHQQNELPANYLLQFDTRQLPRQISSEFFGDSLPFPDRHLGKIVPMIAGRKFCVN